MRTSGGNSNLGREGHAGAALINPVFTKDRRQQSNWGFCASTKLIRFSIKVVKQDCQSSYYIISLSRIIISYVLNNNHSRYQMCCFSFKEEKDRGKKKNVGRLLSKEHLVRSPVKQESELWDWLQNLVCRKARYLHLVCNILLVSSIKKWETIL